MGMGIVAKYLGKSVTKCEREKCFKSYFIFKRNQPDLAMNLGIFLMGMRKLQITWVQEHHQV